MSAKPLRHSAAQKPRGRPKTSTKVQWKRWVEPSVIPELEALLGGAAPMNPPKALANDVMALLEDVGRLEAEKVELQHRVEGLISGSTDEAVAMLRYRLGKAEARVHELEGEQFS